MKRISNLFGKICTIENINLADDKARKNKTKRYGINLHDKNRILENQQLLEKLQNLTYQTSQYSTYTIYEPKERLIFRLPYYPDRITHHAIMNIMEPVWVNIFIKNTYSCIKGRGIHKLAKDLKKALNAKEETKYCLKLDIRKFYPSINHDILLKIIKRKVKDKKLLQLLSEIIYSAEGVPIGNYLSQFFANLYLAYFDHWVKEELQCKYYFRYADDIVILSNNKQFLRNVLLAIKLYLKHELKLNVKPNYQIFPIDSRGLDFIGYKFYHTHVLLRKSIKLRIFKLINLYKNKKISRKDLKNRMSSYFGWLKYCNSKNLLRKIQKLTGFKYSNWNGQETNISRFYNKYVRIYSVINYNQYFKIHLTYNKIPFIIKSNNKQLWYSIHKYKLPINFKIIPYVRKSQQTIQ